MSKLQLNKLTKSELDEFVRLRKKYASHDKVDMLIHKTLKSMGVLEKDFLNRKTIKLERKQVVSEAPPQEVMYCNTDKCEIELIELNKS